MTPFISTASIYFIAGAMALPVLILFIVALELPTRFLSHISIPPFWSSEKLLAFFDAYVPPAFTEHMVDREKIFFKIEAASMPRSWTVVRVVAAQMWLLYAGIIFGLFLGWPDVKNLVLYPILFAYIGFRLPLYVLDHAFRRRQNYIRSQISSIIDLIKLQVSCGLSLEQSLEMIGNNRNDAWGREIQRVSFLLQGGQSLERSLDLLLSRVTSDELARFVSAIKQSKILGVSMEETLHLQAEMIRKRRKQKAEERARTASVRIVLPLVLCIFPALLIVFLGPAMLRLSGGGF